MSSLASAGMGVTARRTSLAELAVRVEAETDPRLKAFLARVLARGYTAQVDAAEAVRISREENA